MFTHIAALDHASLEWVLAHRDPTWLAFFLQVTHMGDLLAILFVSLAIALILGLHDRRSEMFGLVAAVGGTYIAAEILKNALARPRPDAVYAAYAETGFSFPSEHATLSAALVTFIVYLFWRNTRSRILRAGAIVTGAFLIIEVAVIRIYLGVHYPSDVIIGVILGLACAGGGILLERFLEQRRG